MTHGIEKGFLTLPGPVIPRLKSETISVKSNELKNKEPNLCHQTH